MSITVSSFAGSVVPNKSLNLFESQFLICRIMMTTIHETGLKTTWNDVYNMNKGAWAMVGIVHCNIGLKFSPLLFSCDFLISLTKGIMYIFLILDFNQYNKKEESVLDLSLSFEASFILLVPLYLCHTMSRILPG